MLCPKCNATLAPWPWQDGGYKGVQCTGCSMQWWSDTFELEAAKAAAGAVTWLINTSTFPADAVTDEDRKRQWDETRSGDD